MGDFTEERANFRHCWLSLQRRASVLGDQSSLRFSRMMPMSLSPRPEMFTITTSDFFIFWGALDGFGYGVGGFERGDDAFGASQQRGCF